MINRKKLNSLMYSTTVLLALLTVSSPISAQENDDAALEESELLSFNLKAGSDGSHITGTVTNTYELHLVHDSKDKISIPIDEEGHFTLYISDIKSDDTPVLEATNKDGELLLSEKLDKELINYYQENEALTDELSDDASIPDESSSNESKSETQAVMSSFSVSKSAVEQIEGKTSYIVNKVDVDASSTAESIVTRLKKDMSINVSVEELLEWNNISNENELKVNDVLFIDGYAPDGFMSTNPAPYSTPAEFLDYVSPYAREVAEEYGIYASVMTAQAIKETGWGTSDISMPPFHNLFGMKADSTDEYSVIKETSEVINGKSIRVLAPFKVYNSYREGFISNAERIRYGRNWNPELYSGSWIEKALRYTDSTAWLTGRYATDPAYGEGLNDIIERYSLTDFDTHPTVSIQNQRNVNYKFIINKPHITIDSLPYRVADFHTIDFTTNYLNHSVNATKEATTSLGRFYLVEIGGVELGWVSRDALISELSNLTPADYEATIIGNNHNIFTQPARSFGSERVAFSNNLRGQVVEVISEASFDGENFALLTINGKEFGWINVKGIEDNYLQISSNKKVDYKVSVRANGHNIFSSPVGTAGSQRTFWSTVFRDQEVDVLEEAKTENGTYLKISQNGSILGWVHENGVSSPILPIIDSYALAYEAKILNNGYDLYSAPENTSGSQRVLRGEDVSGKTIKVYTEQKTEEGTYAQISIDGVTGWINTNALNKNYAKTIRNKAVSYNATIKGNGHNIFSNPAWSEGNRRLASSKDFAGKDLVITAERVTENGTFARVNIEGNTGWINVRGLNGNYDEIISTNSVSYGAVIRGNGHNIFSTPAWTEGNERLLWSTDYRNQEVSVTSEITTQRGTYAQIKVGNVTGWIHVSGLTRTFDKVISDLNVAYKANIIGNSHNIFSSPVGTEGSKRVAWSSNVRNQPVTVYNEKVTDSGNYARVSVGGVTGWIHTNGLSKNYKPVTDRRKVNYQGTIRGDGNNIYSSPAWSKGNVLQHRSSDLRGQKVSIVEEAFTSDGKYFLLALNGQTLGWIRQPGITLAKPVVYLDAGHGGTDTGASGKHTNNIHEKDVALDLTKKLERVLKDKGYYVIMSRTSDVTMSLSDRAQDANRHNPDLFVSVHLNSFNGVAQGIETFYYNQQGNTSNDMANDKDRIEKSKKAAEEIQKEMIKATGAVDRGVKQANFHVLRETKVPSVLLEGGFLDHPTERAKLLQDRYQNTLANAISKAITSFFNLFR